MAANSREYPAAGTKDVFLPLEAREFGDRLYKPISSSLRIKYSCFAVSGQLIVLGANTGAVYVLVRDSLSYIGFIPNKERDIRIARFSPDGKYLGIGTGCGVVIVWEINIRHLQASKKILEATEHRGSHISDMIWDNKGQQIFVGDTEGKVTVAHFPGVLPRTVLSSTGGIRLRKPGIILVCETPVVQLDYDNDYLLVSCKHKSAVLNLKREEVISVGSQERDGIYGACFYRSMHVSPQHTHILSARPKARIWKASLDGKVELTYKLKDLLAGVGMTPIYGMSFKSEAEISEQEAPVTPNVFKRIRVINDHLIVWNANMLYILNLLSNTITHHSLNEDIEDLHVFESDVWISVGDPLRIRCLSLLHYNQLIKSLSQLHLHSQITELGETLQRETDVGLPPVPELRYANNSANEHEERAPAPVGNERLLVVPTDIESASLHQQETDSVALDTNYIPLAQEQEASCEGPCLIQINPDVSNTDLNETIVPFESDNACSAQQPPSYFRPEGDNPVPTDLAVTVKQSSEIEATHSTGLVNSSFDERSLPFPKASRIRKSQSLREGDLSSSLSPKLVRKRSKKGNSNVARPLSQSEIEIDTCDSFTRVDLFATDIFQDTLIRAEPTHSPTLTELRNSPISQHIPRSERKKKQKMRDSKPPQVPLTPNNPEQTSSVNRTDLSEADFNRDSVAPEDGLTEKVHESKGDSNNSQVFEQFIQASQQTWDELESGEDDLSDIFRSLSAWLSSFVTFLTAVPASSLPGSYTIASLTSLSRSPHFLLLHQLATAAMLAGCWLSLSFPNPLLPNTTSPDAYNFFYLQAIFLSLPEVRSYLTEQQLLVDRSRAYSLYIKGLEDFKGIVIDFSNSQMGSLLNIESQTFPLDIKGNILSEIGFCVGKFPCLLPWEIHTILFGDINSSQQFKSHRQSQVYLEYMEELFLSAEAVPCHRRLLNTAFSTDYKSFTTWCCLSLSFLPSSTKLTVNNIDTPMPHSHLLDWRYKQVWELILSWDVITPDLARECVAYFKRHCFWLGLISAYFSLDCKEKAIPLLLYLNDVSLIGQCNPAWGEYPSGSSDWKLTIESFLTIYSEEFEDLSRRDEARDRFYNLFSLAITEIGCQSGIELLGEIVAYLETSTGIKSWFPYELFLRLVKVANIEKEKSKIAFSLLEKLDEELWKQKPSAISLQFLSQEQLNPNKSVHSSLTLETSSFQWGIRVRKNQFNCQSCHIDITSPLPLLPTDTQVFPCGHCYHKACLVEGACTLCFSEASQ